MDIDYRPLAPVAQHGFTNSCQTYAASDAIFLARALAGLPLFDIGEGWIFQIGQDDSRAHGFNSVGPLSPINALRAVAALGYCSTSLHDQQRHKIVWSAANFTRTQDAQLGYIRDALAAGRVPIVVGMYSAQTDSDGIVLPISGGQGVAHAMSVYGISDSKRLVGPCKNMLGPAWGDHGFAWFPFSFLGPNATGFYEIQCCATVDGLIEDGVLVTPKPPTQPEVAVTYDQIIAAIAAGTWTPEQVMGLRAATAALVVPVAPLATVNVALASNGGVASFSSSTANPVTGAQPGPTTINDGDRVSLHTERWRSGLPLPQWAQVTFSGPQPISRIVTYTLQDDPSGSHVDPADTMTARQYPNVDFYVEALVGGQWQRVGSVSGNTRVKNTFTFPTITASAVRCTITKSADGYARLVEMEAWTPTGGTA